MYKTGPLSKSSDKLTAQSGFRHQRELLYHKVRAHQLKYLPQIFNYLSREQQKETGLAGVSSIFFMLISAVGGWGKLYLFHLCLNPDALYYARTGDFSKIKMSLATYLWASGAHPSGQAQHAWIYFQTPGSYPSESHCWCSRWPCSSVTPHLLSWGNSLLQPECRTEQDILKSVLTSKGMSSYRKSIDRTPVPTQHSVPWCAHRAESSLASPWWRQTACKTQLFRVPASAVTWGVCRKGSAVAVCRAAQAANMQSSLLNWWSATLPKTHIFSLGDKRTALVLSYFQNLNNFFKALLLFFCRQTIQGTLQLLFLRPLWVKSDTAAEQVFFFLLLNCEPSSWSCSFCCPKIRHAEDKQVTDA